MARFSLGLFGAFAAAMWIAAEAAPVSAQCCGATPTVAFSPVVVQPAVVQPTLVRTGWYPGAWLDRMRLRRWTVAQATPPVATVQPWTVGFAPTQPVAWAQTQTVGFAPVAQTVGFRPTITAFAPLQTQVVQTSFAPAVSASPCTSCAQTTTVGYAPSTVFRPVEVTPIQTAIVTPACTTCSVETPCNACSACTSGVSQASFVEAAATVAADCPGCAATSSGIQYYEGATQAPSSAMTGPATPQPELPPNVPEPAAPEYGANRPAAPANGAGTENGAQQEESSVVEPSPGADDATGPEAEPAAETDSNTSYEFQAPPLLGPQNDRTANRPTVDVHNAVYRAPVRQAKVSTAAAKVIAPATKAVDANGWYSVKDRE